jgi:hypothetical protein
MLTVSDEDGSTGQTTRMVIPAAGHPSRCLLVFGTDATVQIGAVLLNAHVIRSSDTGVSLLCVPADVLPSIGMLKVPEDALRN